MAGKLGRKALSGLYLFARLTDFGGAFYVMSRLSSQILVEKT